MKFENWTSITDGYVTCICNSWERESPLIGSWKKFEKWLYHKNHFEQTRISKCRAHAEPVRICDSYPGACTVLQIAVSFKHVAAAVAILQRLQESILFLSTVCCCQCLVLHAGQPTSVSCMLKQRLELWTEKDQRMLKVELITINKWTNQPDIWFSRKHCQNLLEHVTKSDQIL